jgi:leucyl-tRNA synthetase
VDAERYDPQQVEPKWVAAWEEAALYRADEGDERRPRFYALDMFPYPSGDLHMGHLEAFSGGDVIARLKRMQGYNVLHPIGWDAFGLPAENAAIKRGVHPKPWTYQNIDAQRATFHRLGTSFDWTRALVTCDPDYYRWTQWLFLRFFERGLAYRKASPVNWCPNDQTVLANEQVINGRCERCSALVEKRELTQWFFKITEYAQRLLDDMEHLDWSDKVLTQQRNWIGRSEGADVDFQVAETGEMVRVFTTRPDTLFGATFFVLAPEHPLAGRLVAGTEREATFRAFRERVGRETEIERLSTERDKEGVFLGAHAVNPVNGELIPIWAADYVLMEYGTGAIMAVPAHDQRDLEFARKYRLPVRVVVQPAGEEPLDGATLTEAMSHEGVLVNSDGYDGLPATEEGIPRITADLEARGLGGPAVNFRLRDWLLSRQRYWGCPIPIIHCPACGEVPVPDDQLPVLLPEDITDFRPKGRSPLATSEAWVNVDCPRCGGPARRETDTMDTFVDSSWYFFRYADPHNDRAIFDRDKAEYWMPLDQYIGGVEHAILHLLYARFVTKFLYDIGLSPVTEPFMRMFTQGMLVRDGAKMSKSKGNVVPPDSYYEEYGADALRLFELFVGPPTDDAVWNDAGVPGTKRFLDRVWNMGAGDQSFVDRAEDQRDRDLLAATHRTLKRVTEDIDRFHFNTTVSSLMTLTNVFQGYLSDSPRVETFDEAYRIMILMLAPMAPHIAHELWEIRGRESMLAREPWPSWDQSLTAEATVTMVVQVNGKVRDRVDVPADISPEDAERLALGLDKVQGWIDGGVIQKVIARPPNLINLVVG